VSKLLLAGIVFGALIAPAIAADMQIKARPRVPPLAWSGFYAGLNVGYADPQNGVITAANPTPDVALEHLTKRLNRLWIHMTARIRFNIPTGTRGPVMNGEALFR
jgi:opacity protein-like surface antigen